MLNHNSSILHHPNHDPNYLSKVFNFAFWQSLIFSLVYCWGVVDDTRGCVWNHLQPVLISLLHLSELSQNIPQVKSSFTTFIVKFYSRLLFLLGIIDTVHLVTSLLSFSLPTLSSLYRDNIYHNIFPYTFPIAQVPQLLTNHHYEPCVCRRVWWCQSTWQYHSQLRGSSQWSIHCLLSDTGLLLKNISQKNILQSQISVVHPGSGYTWSTLLSCLHKSKLFHPQHSGRRHHWYTEWDSW